MCDLRMVLFRSGTGKGTAEWLKGQVHLDAAGHIFHLLVPLLEQLWSAHHNASNPGTYAVGMAKLESGQSNVSLSAPLCL